MFGYNEADIYCAASKTGLATRKPAFLEYIQNLANTWKADGNLRYFSFVDYAEFIAALARKDVIKSGWNEYDKDGASWYIANYVDAAVKARDDFKNKYDDLFRRAFNIYFNLNNNLPL